MPKSVKLLLSLIFSILLASSSFAQIISPPKWDIQISDKEAKVGDEIELVFKAKIPLNWYIYSNDFDPDLGPLLTELSLEDSLGVERAGKLKAIGPKTKFEEIWEGEVTYFDGEGEFRQRFTVTAESAKIGGHLFYQMCSDRSEEHTSELQSRPHLVCRLLLEKKKKNRKEMKQEKKKKKKIMVQSRSNERRTYGRDRLLHLGSHMYVGEDHTAVQIPSRS